MRIKVTIPHISKKKDHVVQVLTDGQWRTVNHSPMTYLQAIRLMLGDLYLSRCYERQEARVIREANLKKA